MSTWRRKAMDLFPEVRQELHGRGNTIYRVFHILRPLLQEALRKGDLTQAQQIGDYAAWCARQKDKNYDLWNAAGVSFYEHLPDEPETLKLIPELVPPDVFADVKVLLDLHMGPQAFAELCDVYQQRRIDKGPGRRGVRCCLHELARLALGKRGRQPFVT